MAPTELVNASTIDAQALSDLGGTHEIVDVDLPSHATTVIRGPDSEGLTTFVFTDRLQMKTFVVITQWPRRWWNTPGPGRNL